MKAEKTEVRCYGNEIGIGSTQYSSKRFVMISTSITKILPKIQSSGVYPWLIWGFNQWRHPLRSGLPTMVNIEVSQGCNRRCHYCPISEFPTKLRIIDEDFWKLFKSRAQEWRWRGMIGLSRYNELGLVAGSERYVAEVREIGALPHIFSNGDKPEQIRAWCRAGAFRIVITEHPPQKVGWREKVMELQSEFPSIIVVKTLSPEMLHNHGGEVEVETKRNPTYCQAQNTLTIDIDGRVLICCLDFHSQHVFGNIKEDSFEEIWTNQKYRAVRQTIINRKPGTKLCSTCSLL